MWIQKILWKQYNATRMFIIRFNGTPKYQISQTFHYWPIHSNSTNLADPEITVNIFLYEVKRSIAFKGWVKLGLHYLSKKWLKVALIYKSLYNWNCNVLRDCISPCLSTQMLRLVEIYLFFRPETRKLWRNQIRICHVTSKEITSWERRSGDESNCV